jgi:hypothetical protein
MKGFLENFYKYDVLGGTLVRSGVPGEAEHRNRVNTPARTIEEGAG